MEQLRSLFNPLRHLVSGDKTRHKSDGYDLDFTYITDRIIAMAFPGEGIEGCWRNAAPEVASFLKGKHGEGHYRIYNLSERTYDYDRFGDMQHDPHNAAVVEWGFPDHHNPPLGLLFEICENIDEWLNRDKDNVVSIHCLAGRGRTGTVIACYLTYCGMFDNGSEALDFFARKRSITNRGVQQPSQRRYVQYFSEILHGRLPKPGRLRLKRLVMYSIPVFDKKLDGCCPVLEIFTAPSQHLAKKLLYSSLHEQYDEVRRYTQDDGFISFTIDKELEGDIYLRMYHLKMIPPRESVVIGSNIRSLQDVKVSDKKKTRERQFMLRVSFHTGFVPKASVLRLTKTELDDAIKSRKFDRDFFVDFIWERADGEEYRVKKDA